MVECTVILPWPDRALSPNASRPGAHWAKKAKAVTKARAAGHHWTMAGGAWGVFRDYDGPIGATITFHPPDRRRRDRDNMIASFKAYQDGIAHGTYADDSRWVPTYRVGEPTKGGKVVVVLRNIDTERERAAE